MLMEEKGLSISSPKRKKQRTFEQVRGYSSLFVCPCGSVPLVSQSRQAVRAVFPARFSGRQILKFQSKFEN